MNAQQKAAHREFYNQLRLAIVFPGDTIAGVTKPYAPVNKDEWTFDFAMTQPDTPAVAHLRTRERRMWLTWKAA
jgi:hypothetical protein